jgi:hypothetical protein
LPALLLWGFCFLLLLYVKLLQPENLFLPICGLAGLKIRKLKMDLLMQKCGFI